MTTESNRLVDEFGAQDCLQHMVVFKDGKNTEVAIFNNANQDWDLMPAGREMLASADAPAEAPAVEEPPAPPPAGNLSSLTE